MLKNIANAIRIGDILFRCGYIPFISHAMTMPWELKYPKEYETWIGYCLEWVERCDALFRIPGHSPGSDREVMRAEMKDIPRFFGNLRELIDTIPPEDPLKAVAVLQCVDPRELAACPIEE